MKYLEPIKLVSTVLLTTFADRLAQLQLLAFVVMSGPAGEGSGSSAFAALLPCIVLGFLAGSVCDRINRRAGLLSSTLLRAVIVIAQAPLIGIAGASGMSVALTLAALSTCTTFYSLCAFSIVPQTVIRPNMVQATNAAVWLAALIANFMAIHMCASANDEMNPAQSLRICFIVYCLAIIAAWLMKRYPAAASHAKSTAIANDFSSTFLYLRRHSRVLDFLRLAIVFTFASSLWYAAVIALVVENYQLSGLAVQQIFSCLSIGLGVGALLAVPGAKTAGLIKLLSISATLITLLAICLTGSFNLAFEQLLLGSMGVSLALALVTMDTVMQRITPTRVRGKIAAIRYVIVSILLLLAIVALEQFVARISAVAMLRVLAVATLCTMAILLLTWRHFGIFIAQSTVLRLLRAKRHYKFDGEHNLQSRGVSIFALNNFKEIDAAILVGSFKGSARFISSRQTVSPVTAWILRRLAGESVGKNSSISHSARALISRGHSVCILLDGLDESQKKEVAKLQRQYSCQIVPTFLSQSSGKTLIRFAIPINGAKKMSEKALLAEISAPSHEGLERIDGAKLETSS